MTAPATVETIGKCAVCPARIVWLGGVSWRHIGRAGGHPHPADPDQETREQTREVA